MHLKINKHSVIADASRQPHYINKEQWRRYNWSATALCGQPVFFILVITDTTMCYECLKRQRMIK